jgi:hypothetical protein
MSAPQTSSSQTAQPLTTVRYFIPIEHVDESDEELSKRKSRFIKPSSELHEYLFELTKAITKVGFPMDTRRYKSFNGYENKAMFYTELVKKPNLEEMKKVSAEFIAKKLDISKFQFSFKGSLFLLNVDEFRITVGYIQKNLYEYERKRVQLITSMMCVELNEDRYHPKPKPVEKVEKK